MPAPATAAAGLIRPSNPPPKRLSSHVATGSLRGPRDLLFCPQLQNASPSSSSSSGSSQSTSRPKTHENQQQQQQQQQQHDQQYDQQHQNQEVAAGSSIDTEPTSLATTSRKRSLYSVAAALQAHPFTADSANPYVDLTISAKRRRRSDRPSFPLTAFQALMSLGAVMGPR